jgi:hypothetical protein
MQEALYRWKNEPYHPKLTLQLKGVYLDVPSLKIPECSILSMIKNRHDMEYAIVEALRVRLSRRTNELLIRGGACYKAERKGTF